MPIQNSLKIAIAGAGLLGRLLAWKLLEHQHQVTLYETGSMAQSKSAAYTAAAMISPMSEVVVSERSIYQMGIHSLGLWPQWIQQLNIGLEKPVFYNTSGSLVVAHRNDESELEQFYQELCFHLGKNNTSRWLDRDGLYVLEPDLNPEFHRGLYLPDEAYLDNRYLLQALLQAIIKAGGQIHENTHIRLQPQALANGNALEGYDYIIDCRGMGAKRDQSTLRGVRGEVLWVETDEVRLSRPVRLMHPRYKLYIVPKPKQRFIIGATEIESEDCSPVSVQSMLELCSALYTINPAFAEARILELDANLRPAFIDNMPHIEQQPTLDTTSAKIISLNGLYRHGYLLAPTMVEHTLNMIHKTGNSPFPWLSAERTANPQTTKPVVL